MEVKYLPQKVGQKEYNELGKVLSLMLRMCRPIFGSGKAVVLYSGFCVTKGITELESKSFNDIALIKKQRCYLEVVPCDLIDTHF